MDGVALGASLDDTLFDPADELPSLDFGAEPEPPAVPPRKSVTYQPDPFNWNPAAVTCFAKLACPQLGHCVNGASLSFCNTSFSKPHASQRYA